MLDERHLNGTTGESKSYTVIHNGNAITTVTNLYYELQEQSDRDYVEVVRCKNCKHWHTEGQYCDRFGVLWEEFYTSPNDYCSRGERREDAETD